MPLVPAQSTLQATLMCSVTAASMGCEFKCDSSVLCLSMDSRSWDRLVSGIFFRRCG